MFCKLGAFNIAATISSNSVLLFQLNIENDMI